MHQLKAAVEEPRPHKPVPSNRPGQSSQAQQNPMVLHQVPPPPAFPSETDLSWLHRHALPDEEAGQGATAVLAGPEPPSEPPKLLSDVPATPLDAPKVVKPTPGSADQGRQAPPDTDDIREKPAAPTIPASIPEPATLDEASSPNDLSHWLIGHVPTLEQRLQRLESASNTPLTVRRRACGRQCEYGGGRVGVGHGSRPVLTVSRVSHHGLRMSAVGRLPSASLGAPETVSQPARQRRCPREAVGRASATRSG